ncbi:MAG: DUF2318 domain-containing protein [Candidatus Nealsonbacteria bacterium CG15_BIG_FIL_POST_REV_8_21_14_020_37_12]|uniref:DUF2318 domain-containing protein n=2 Tax=Candidatus Nealsoniibacteriota TaxID=1817911 RepID=A0A2M7H0N3_9BACT|nr:MAG: DUF2318 domain-containing protein [Candidatus Nealsonbacteria bacterium CG15_BIG_FIL_POST_REV_8_21_14_020_37_12]
MKNTKILVVFFCLIFLIVAIFTKGFGLFKSSQTNSDGFVNIPLSEVTSNAKWYGYDLGGEKIRFFVVKTSDGSIKTAFDACDVCYRYKKGYRQEGDYMVCNNCGNRYPMVGLGTENKNPGGCWPGYLPNIIQGDNVLIKKSDLENNRWRVL